MELKRFIKTANDTATISMHPANDSYYLSIRKGHQNFVIAFKDVLSCATCYEVADEDLINQFEVSFTQHSGISKFSFSLN